MTLYKYTKKAKKFLLIVLYGISYFSYSQVTPLNDLDKKYQPSENSIFNKSKRKSEISRTGLIELNNCIKFSPTAILSRKILFLYERQIVDGFTFNLGVGKAFDADRVSRILFSEFTDRSGEMIMYPASVITNSEYDESSVLLQGGLRFYYSGQTYDEGYIEINFRQETMNYILNSKVDGYKVEGSRVVKMVMKMYNFGYGYTLVAGKNNNFIHDFFLNFGINYCKYTRFSLVESNTPFNNGYYDMVYRGTTSFPVVRLLPFINVGYAFGFGF